MASESTTIHYDSYVRSLRTRRCDFCNGRLDTKSTNSCAVCNRKDENPTNEAESDEMLLRRFAFTLFRFFMWFRRSINSHVYTVSKMNINEAPVVMWNYGIPGKKLPLPVYNGFHASTQCLFEYVLLSWMECHQAMLLLPDIVRAQLAGP